MALLGCHLVSMGSGYKRLGALAPTCEIALVGAAIFMNTVAFTKAIVSYIRTSFTC